MLPINLTTENQISSNNIVTRKWYFNPVYWLLIIVAVPIAWILITQEPDKRLPVYGYTQGLTVFSSYLHKLEEQLQKTAIVNQWVSIALINEFYPDSLMDLMKFWVDQDLNDLSERETITVCTQNYIDEIIKNNPPNLK